MINELFGGIDQARILGPVIAMALLTLLVATRLAVVNVGAVLSRKVSLKKFKFFSDMPEAILGVSQHYKNMFELPVLFYVWALWVFMSGDVGTVELVSAWLFVASRYVHSLIRWTTNEPKIRFTFFLVGYLILVFMWVRMALGYFLY